MEKFAVDLDKVLDDFELDEDESESVNQYEKLQLEFCPDGGSGASSAAMRHNIGLGAFGGWSEPIHSQAVPPISGSNSEAWCDNNAPQPPGTRSPPDGQNDDSEQSATCSQRHPVIPFHQGDPQALQSQCPSQSSQPQSTYPQSLFQSTISQPQSQSTVSFDADSRIPQQQCTGSSSTLWPVMASSSSLIDQPEQAAGGFNSHSEVSNDNKPYSSLLCQLPDFAPTDQSSGPSKVNEDHIDASRDSLNTNSLFRNVDVIASRPLDVVPSCMSSEQRQLKGHEGQHPDIIDVWQSGNGSEGIRGESTSAPSLPVEGIAPPDLASRNVVDEESVGAMALPNVSQNVMNINVNAHESQEQFRLLPDLMSMNNSDNPDLGGEEQNTNGVEFSEPAVVMENALCRLNGNDPAIVLESQSGNRVPEIVNVHQTAENRSHLENMAILTLNNEISSNNSADTARNSLESVDNSVPADRASGFHSNQICDNLADVDEAVIHDSDRNLESQDSSHSALPDISVVNPVPVSFNKDNNIDDADLDAELAELEEEQFRLQGAYGESLNLQLCSGEKDFDNQTLHEPKNMIGGPDLIGGMNTSQSDLQSNNIDDKVPPAVLKSTKNATTCQEIISSQNRGLLGGSDNSEFPQYEVNNVEEVICHPQNNEISSNSFSPDENNKTQRSVINENESSVRNDDGADNVSNASTGTDTLSSSSTLTDGDIGSPERTQPAATDQPESPSRVTPGTLVTAVYDDDSGSGREDELETSDTKGAARQGVRDQHQRNNLVGQVAPFWIPDEDASHCQECGQKFTVIRRRHHCRACGRVLCAQCCHDKAPLPYMDYKEARVCGLCLQLIQMDQSGDRPGEGNETNRQPHPDGPRRPPDPNNPMEYCSRIPPLQQAAAAASAPPPTVMVPVGVLKRDGGSSSSARNRGGKQVIFSDGIRPGGDLTELDGSRELVPPYRRPGRVARRVDRPSAGSGVGSGGGLGGLLRSLPPDRCLIPPGAGLPPVVVQAPSTGEYVFENNPDSSKLSEQMRGDGPPVVFAIHKNLTVLVKMVKLECCVGVEVWNIATRGLCTVGQEEMVVLLEVAPGEMHPPRDAFAFFHTVYQQANQGNLVTEMGHTIFTEPEGFLGSREHGGFLYIRPTFQCLHNLVLPPSPYIFAVLIQKWETPWAKVFPLRLMLRMGAEFRYYPCPLVSTRNRKPVFCEIGHTIMNLLVDFRNYAYTVPTIEGFVIHMEDKKTSLLFPKNRYEQVTKALSNSNDHVLALGANFSPQADSHLVTIENDDGHYSTQAINIHNRPRKVTGASFIVFNGALKSTSGLSAKSSIVEDGLMVQIPADKMTKLREALRNMKEFEIPCGPVTAKQADEIVVIKWISDDKNFNVGIKSPIDERQMDGIQSVKIHSGTDYVSNAHLIRWTEVFILQGETNNSNDINLSRLSEILARAFCVALTPHLGDLYACGYTRLGLRSTVHQDNVGYEAGSNGSRLPANCMNDLDTELIPVIHRGATNITDEPIILELVFHIMEQ